MDGNSDAPPPAPTVLRPAGPSDILNQANALIGEEKAERALKLVRDFLLDRDHPQLWLKLARIYLLLGDELIARALYRNVVLKHKNPHIMDIIAANIPNTKVLVLDNLKFVYFNIPKCGSSSIKDAILVANKQKRRGEASHSHVHEFEKIIPFQALDDEYSGYTKLAVIRHPLERLRSYYRKNIAEAGSLKAEIGGKASHYGLSSQPPYGEILENFARYRQVFDDFRHHTDSMIGYLGRDRSRFTHLFDIADTEKAIGLIGSLASTDMPEIHNMRSKSAELQLAGGDTDAELGLMHGFYAREIEVFFT